MAALKTRSGFRVGSAAALRLRAVAGGAEWGTGIGGPPSLPPSSDPGGVRDPGEWGGGPGARPLTGPYAQQQLLHVQPQLLHGEGVREEAWGRGGGKSSPPRTRTRSPGVTPPHPLDLPLQPPGKLLHFIPRTI